MDRSKHVYGFRMERGSDRIIKMIAAGLGMPPGEAIVTVFDALHRRLSNLKFQVSPDAPFNPRHDKALLEKMFECDRNGRDQQMLLDYAKRLFEGGE